MSQPENPSPKLISVSELQAMHQLVTDQHAPSIIPIEAGAVLVAARDRLITDLTPFYDKVLPGTRRAKGVSQHQTLASLIAFTNRFKRAETVSFCNVVHDGEGQGAMATLRTVIDYHPDKAVVVDDVELSGGHCDFAAQYDFPSDPIWSLFAKADGKDLDVSQFAELLEKGFQVIRDAATIPNCPTLPDVTYGAPTDLLLLTRGLRVATDRRVANVENRADGSGEISFAESNTTHDAHGRKVEVPGAFVIVCPVFIEGLHYVQPIRLRYRSTNGRIVWTVERHNPHLTVTEAVKGARAIFAQETQVPVFDGTP